MNEEDFLSMSGSIIENALGANGGDMRRTTMSWAMPFIRTLEETLANVEDTEDISDEDIEELTTIFQSLGNSCSTNNINNNNNNNKIETIQNRQS
uniref:Uncharacterized protein n=1 Tax=Romanomermis culicivorax TaxID=13658 RepID=A0A915JRI3_ROMCU